MSDYILRCSASNAINLPKKFIEEMGWKLNDKITLTEVETLIGTKKDHKGLLSLDVMKREDRDMLDKDEENELNDEEWKEYLKNQFEIIKEKTK